MVLIHESNFYLSCSRTHSVFLVLVVFQDPLQTEGVLFLVIFCYFISFPTGNTESVFQYLGSGRKDAETRSPLTARFPAVCGDRGGLHPRLRDPTASSLQFSAARFPSRPDFKALSSGACVPRPALAASSSHLSPRQHAWNLSDASTCPVSLHHLLPSQRPRGTGSLQCPAAPDRPWLPTVCTRLPARIVACPRSGGTRRGVRGHVVLLPLAPSFLHRQKCQPLFGPTPGPPCRPGGDPPPP